VHGEECLKEHSLFSCFYVLAFVQQISPPFGCFGCHHSLQSSKVVLLLPQIKRHQISLMFPLILEILATLSAGGPFLPGFECVGLESQLITFSTSCVQRWFLVCSPVVAWEVDKDKIKPSSS